MPISAAVAQVMQQMEQEGTYQLTQQMTSWMGEIKQVISALNAYQATTNSTLNKSAQLAVQRMIQSGNYNARIYNNVSEAKRQVKYQAYVRKGYTLLNKIGESIRGKEINYQLIVRAGDGSAVYDWKGVSLDDFLELTTISDSGRMRMTSSSNNIIDALSKKYQSKEQVAWDDQKRNAYEYFKNYITNYVDSNGKQKWANLNQQGSILEAFTKYYDTKTGNMEDYMERTMSGNQAFWKGGDYGDIQIKSNEASVTSISSIITQLESTYSKLSSIQNITSLQSNKPTINTQGIEDNIRKEIETKVQDLVKDFITTSLTI